MDTQSIRYSSTEIAKISIWIDTTRGRGRIARQTYLQEFGFVPVNQARLDEVTNNE